MSADQQREETSFLVDPARLAAGSWCPGRERTIGGGDISASYSAERIGLGEPVRRPFSWRGGLYVCVGIQYSESRLSAQAYRLCAPQHFAGPSVSYPERCANGDAARSDPLGFYHGIRITHAGREYVLCGPEATFLPDESWQLALF